VPNTHIQADMTPFLPRSRSEVLESHHYNSEYVQSDELQEHINEHVRDNDSYLAVFTPYNGKPLEVLNAGDSLVPSSSAFFRRMSSLDNAYAERRPPR
jgi:hypothetical protein